MTNSKHSPEVTVVSAKQMILNKLCTAYIRFEDDGLIPADELRRELDIPETVFAEALESFINGENQMAVEVFKSKGSTDLRLSESMRDLCSDWNPGEKHDPIFNTESPVEGSALNFWRRSA
jgi:hypothetical protein